MIELGAHSNSIKRNWICKTNLGGRGELSNDPSDARSGLNMLRFFLATKNIQLVLGLLKCETYLFAVYLEPQVAGEQMIPDRC